MPVPPTPSVSIVIPARNVGAFLDRVLLGVSSQDAGEVELEILVADDGSTDDTPVRAAASGATVVACIPPGGEGNPAAARNQAAELARGHILVFLDSDCVPQPGWLRALLARFAKGETCVGGSLELPDGLPPSARCDYYCGWYHVHAKARGGPVLNHPPGNIAVERRLFLECGGYVVHQPLAYSHEELRWQAELQRRGHRIYFEPSMRVDHWNRPGWGNLHRRNYRWGYPAIEAKAETGIVRWRFLYEHPLLLVAAAPFLAPAQALYIVACWLRAGVLEPVLMLPVIFSAKCAYGVGMAVGGWRWLQRRHAPDMQGVRPKWE